MNLLAWDCFTLRVRNDIMAPYYQLRIFFYWKTEGQLVYYNHGEYIMLILQENTLSDSAPCPYLPDRLMRYEYFFAMAVGAPDLEKLLAAGWRKFGYYYFRPSCDGCRQCIPVRIPVEEFSPSKSQRRTLRKNADVQVEFRELMFTEEVYQIYFEHSISRFGEASDLDDFLFSFYQQSCPAMQSEYYIDDELKAVGFLDVSSMGISTVYFIYRNDITRRGPGIFSILREIEFTRSMGLPYYYLGYYVPGCSRMEYKSGFKPLEAYSWDNEKWEHFCDQ